MLKGKRTRLGVKFFAEFETEFWLKNRGKYYCWYRPYNCIMVYANTRLFLLDIDEDESDDEDEGNNNTGGSNIMSIASICN